MGELVGYEIVRRCPDARSALRAFPCLHFIIGEFAVSFLILHVSQNYK